MFPKTNAWKTFFFHQTTNRGQVLLDPGSDNKPKARAFVQVYGCGGRTSR